MSGNRDFADVGRLRVVRWPVFVLPFNGQCQKMNQCIDRKGLVDQLIDAAADGFCKDTIIPVGGNQKTNCIRVRDAGQL